jgi:organic hydroperoxide reductase OsmC/OhrA
MSKPAGSFQMRVEQVDGYQFRVRFDKPEYPELLTDEPPPLGHDRGPNPARVLAASIAGCLSASLLFCLSRAKVPVSAVNSDVKVDLVRNENNRLRIGKVGVRLHPRLGPGAAIEGCLDKFEDFCVVTQSVREGVAIDVSVEPEAASALDDQC